MMYVKPFALVTDPAALRGGGEVLIEACQYLAARIAQATDITIISAFYSESFIRHILSSASVLFNGRKLTIVLAAVPEVARREQIKGLKALKKCLLEDGAFDPEKVDIRLVSKPRFLHAKLFRLRASGKPPIYLVGSANASNAAFGQNDEVMVAIKGLHRGLNAYILHVIDNSIPVGDMVEDSIAYDWRSFLRNAFLYFKPNRSITYSIDPFSDEGFQKIAERLQQQIVQRLPFSDPNVLSLNLARLLELSVPQTAKLGFKLPTYSIETDYGYWVPEAYVEFVGEKLSASTGPKQRALAERGEELRQSGEDYVMKQINVYLSEVDRRLQIGARPIRLSKQQTTVISEKITRRVDHLTKLLTHPKSVERLSQTLVGVPVPEFWEDDATVDRFFDGFCYDIIAKLDTPKATPRIVTHLATRFKLDFGDNVATCRTKIETFFEKGGTWSRNDWPPPPPS
jgi:hypothetical protein